MDERNDFNNNNETTEDFTELFGGHTENTEQLDIVNEEKTEELVNIYNRTTISNPQDEIHINDIDEDFSDIVRRRDYRGRVDYNNYNKEKHGKKRKLKKWVYLLILLFLLGLGFGTYKIIDNKILARKKEEEKKIIETIKSHYNDYVKVSKDTKLYEKKDKEYQEVGSIYEGAKLILTDEDITKDTKYFHIKDLDYYIAYEDIEKDIEEEIDYRYKSYLPFNINIVTKDNFTMYLDDDKYITLDESKEFPVIINNYEDKYYVEYNNHLVSISKDDIIKTKDNKNTEKTNQSKITTLAYHRVYDTTDKCTDGYVCIKKESFDKEMKYLSENNYLTLNLNELHMYLKGSLQIEKGVVITFDDGYLFKAADEVLDKYKLNGTMFVISGDFAKDLSRFDGLKSIDIQSHTHSMHKNYVCAGGNQGGAILCAGKAKIVEDLKKSLETLKVEPIGLAYPFYDYNDTAISALKETGFKMAFVGRAGVLGKATPKVTDLYKIPRMTVYDESLMSFNEWKGYL